jgi:hypothetical protein
MKRDDDPNEMLEATGQVTLVVIIGLCAIGVLAVLIWVL